MKIVLLALGLTLPLFSAGGASAMPPAAMSDGLVSPVVQVDWSCGRGRHRAGDGQCYPNKASNRQRLYSCGPGRERGRDGQCYPNKASNRQRLYSCGPGRERGRDGQCYPMHRHYRYSCGAGRHRGGDGQCYPNR